MSDRLTTIEKQLSRLDGFDNKLSAVRAQLDRAAKHQQDLTTSLHKTATHLPQVKTKIEPLGIQLSKS
jgi:septal ring factor EnvC (AmiA/AmiB activator)